MPPETIAKKMKFAWSNGIAKIGSNMDKAELRRKSHTLMSTSQPSRDTYRNQSVQMLTCVVMRGERGGEGGGGEEKSRGCPGRCLGQRGVKECARQTHDRLTT